MWELVDPDTGSNQVDVSLSGAAKTAVAAISFNGVFQSTPTDGEFCDDGLNDPSISITSETGDLVLDVMANVAAGSPTVDGS